MLSELLSYQSMKLDERRVQTVFNFRMPYSHRMPKFKHVCKPCDDCGSSGDPDCLTCEGQSTECDCEAAYDQECDRRYGLWKDEG